jgi:hypothetical protein
MSRINEDIFQKSFDVVTNVIQICVKFEKKNIRKIYKSLTVIKCAKLILQVSILLGKLKHCRS